MYLYLDYGPRSKDTVERGVPAFYAVWSGSHVAFSSVWIPNPQRKILSFLGNWWIKNVLRLWSWPHPIMCFVPCFWLKGRAWSVWVLGQRQNGTYIECIDSWIYGISVFDVETSCFYGCIDFTGGCCFDVIFYSQKARNFLNLYLMRYIYPVIALSFADIKENTAFGTKKRICQIIEEL